MAQTQILAQKQTSPQHEGAIENFMQRPESL
jgi:hypothetical protein